MRPTKTKHRVSATSSHQQKSRRCISTPAPLRLTISFILLLFLLDLSGLIPAIMSLYPATPLLPSPTSLLQSPIPTRPQIQLHHPPPRRKSSLSALYLNLPPTTTMASYVASHPPPQFSPPPPKFQLEMHWTDENFYQKVCRVHNACLLKSGALLVHPWVKSQSHHLRACGVPQLTYMASPTDFTPTTPAASQDLFGIIPTRYHIPHFLTDILPVIYARELLRPTFTPPSLVRTVCEAPRSAPCTKASVAEPLRPSLYIDQRVADMSISSWVPQLSAMVLDDQPHMHFREDMFANDSKVCFRSVVAYNRQYYAMRGEQWFGHDNPIFSSHGLSRRSVRSTTNQILTKKRKGCKKHISILNRVGWTRRGNFLLGRDIVNVDQVVDRVEELVQAKGNENLDVTVSIEYFENMTFVGQVNVMQKADVLLGVHGAGLGNLLFARNDVPILEVQPFGYYAGPFGSLAKALYLPYTRTISEPNTANFKECLQMHADKLGDPAVMRRGMEMWDAAVEERKKGNWFKMQAEKFTDRLLVPVKLCARSQRMKVNPVETARTLIRMVRDLC